MIPKTTALYRLRKERNQCPDCAADVYEHVFCRRCRAKRLASVTARNARLRAAREKTP